MNRKNIIGIALVVTAGALVGFASSEAGEFAVRLLGKGLWYLPYAALVGALRCFAVA